MPTMSKVERAMHISNPDTMETIPIEAGWFRFAMRKNSNIVFDLCMTYTFRLGPVARMG